MPGEGFSPRPLSIKIIAISHALTFLQATLLELAGAHSAAKVLGHFFRGGTDFAIVYNVSTACVSLVIAWGLWKLWNPIRYLAIVYAAYAMANAIPFYLSPLDRRVNMEAFVRGLDPNVGLFMFWLGPFIAMSINGLVMWFLIKRKAAFGKPPTPT